MEATPVLYREAPEASESWPAGKGRRDAIDVPVYEYGLDANGGFDAGSADRAQSVPKRDESESHELFQQLLASETEKAEERGRLKGIEAGTERGLALGREEMARQLRAERERLLAQAAALTQSFVAAREDHFHDLEQEAVKLSLAIAARILRHEAQADPLLLTGAVRVALGQLASSTTVRLRVPAQDEPLWKETLALLPGLVLRPQVIGDAGMELGDCRMETELGSADLGLWPQLKAIERGFFERGSERFKMAEHGAKPAETESIHGD
jgi:flagellar assembly protein FliH